MTLTDLMGLQDVSRILIDCRQFMFIVLVIPRADVMWSSAKCSRCRWDTQWYLTRCCSLNYTAVIAKFEVDMLPWLWSCTVCCCFAANSWRVCSRAVAVARSSFRIRQKWSGRGSCWHSERTRLQWMWVLQCAVTVVMHCWCGVWCLYSLCHAIAVLVC